MNTTYPAQYPPILVTPQRERTAPIPVRTLNTPAKVATNFVTLSNTTLHYMKVGSGPPLVIVPATI